MIANVLNTIQTEFQDNWLLTPIQFSDQNFTPTADSWIRLDVIPLGSTNLSYSGSLGEVHGCYVICYDINQVQASLLADQVSTFFQNRLISGIQVLSYQPKDQGPIVSSDGPNGSYYVKLFFQMKFLEC